MDNWNYSNGLNYINGSFGRSASFDCTPKPNAEFSQVALTTTRTITHLGTTEQRDTITHIGLGLEPVMPGEKRQERTEVYRDHMSSSASSDGSSWANRPLDPGWGPVLELDGGGSKFPADMVQSVLPEYYVADLNINHSSLHSSHPLMAPPRIDTYLRYLSSIVQYILTWT